LLFNKWLLFLFILLHLPPHHLTISCFCNLSHHVTVFPFPCWHCLILSFRQVEVWFLTHSLVHPPLFIFPWIIERRVKSWLTPIGWFPLQLLYWYLTLFLHGTGVLWGISPLLTAPGPLLFLEPHFSFGMLAIPICSVANFPVASPPLHLLYSLSGSAFPVSLVSMSAEPLPGLYACLPYGSCLSLTSPQRAFHSFVVSQHPKTFLSFSYLFLCLYTFSCPTATPHHNHQSLILVFSHCICSLGFCLLSRLSFHFFSHGTGIGVGSLFLSDFCPLFYSYRYITLHELVCGY